MSIETSNAVGLWSTTLQFNDKFDRSQFTRSVRQAAVARQERYTGFVKLSKNLSNNTDIISSFTRTRYPRRKYGIPSIEECEAGMQHLQLTMGGKLWRDNPRYDFRVVFGLVEGYGRDGKLHTVQEVCTNLTGVCIEPAEIFSVRLDESGVGIYTEPAAIIFGGLDRVSAVHDLAEKFKQERYTVEDFKNQVTYTVETSHCTEPDAQF